jgi:AraC family transcriptional regulator of adaptative response/methylated-DNA-[protein]-cysteine methyltransferase
LRRGWATQSGGQENSDPDRKIRVEGQGSRCHIAPMPTTGTDTDVEAGLDYRRMARAIRYLAEHYSEQPRLEDAAGSAGLSPFHFQRVFTRYVGVSPKASGVSVLGAALESGLSGPSRLHDLCLKIEAMTPGEYAAGGENVTIEYGYHPSPFGVAMIMATPKGVCGLAFGDEGDETAMLGDMRKRWPKANYRENTKRTAEIAAKVFGGGKNARELTLHLMGSKWQIQVWRALLDIPAGKVSSYGAIAEKLSAPRASRAVGAAVGRNPISYLIPCHRVLGGDGSLTGYHWGVARKRSMLAVEAARADAA